MFTDISRDYLHDGFQAYLRIDFTIVYPTSFHILKRYLGTTRVQY